MTLRAVRATPDYVLATLFNLFLLVGDVPENLKTSRVMFVPKVKTPVAPGDFRPIAVSSVLLRIFHRVLASRVQASISFDARQRAFTPVDGCAENITVLSSLLRESRRCCRSLFVASLDLQKAFDTVTFGAVMNAAHVAGFPQGFLCYLERLYSASSVVIKAGTHTRTLNVTQGVRQGDPLSPLLINLVIDSLLQRMLDHIGFRLGDTMVNSMAFADDLILVASTAAGLQELLDIARDHLSPRGLHFNAAKCMSLALVASGRDKKVKVQRETFYLGKDLLPIATTDRSWRYLGVNFSVTGRQVPTALQELRGFLSTLTHAPLKPQQRLLMLRQFVVPRLLHRLTLGRLSRGLLRTMDINSRAALRRWLKLPLDCPVAFYHADVNSGGLGVPALQLMVPRLKLGRLQRLETSTFPACVAAARTPSVVEEVRWARLAVTRSGELLDSPALCKGFWARQLHSSVDGRALADAGDVPEAHSWVSDGSGLLRGSDFIQAVKVRINAVPTRARCSRGRDAADRSCRAGCGMVETLGHVTQRCGATHGLRVRRHNNIMDYLAASLQRKGWTVRVEGLLHTSEGRRKPDLVATREDQVAVIDVQVVGCIPSLNRAHWEKADYYNTDEIAALLQGSAPGRPHFTSATVSFRGVWSGDSASDLQDLGITKGDLKIMALKAVQGSATIWKWFTRASVHPLEWATAGDV